MKRRSGVCALLSLSLAFAAAGMPLVADAVGPAPYPNRTIHLIVPFTAGNQLDVFARLIGDRLADSMGQPVIVENRPGASGNAASEAVAKAAPDGYTLLVSGVLITLLPQTYGSRAVDPVVAFAPITRLAQQPIAYATSGVGTAQHIAMTMLSQRAGIETLHVPFANSGQLVASVLSGEVPVAMSFPGTVEPHVNAGRLKALAVTSARRAAAWPDVPTVAESGFAGFDVQSWAGVLAPAGTPPDIIDRLHREIVRILGMPEVRSAFLAQSAEPVGNTPAEFAAEIRSSVARWAPVIKAAGITVN
jgi:tripartite-type tricarboxylate transporter receptor subunit TctC